MKFYPNSQLLTFRMKDYKQEIIGRNFICDSKERSFHCTVKDILPSPPDNLPDYMILQTEDGKVEEISIFDIERLTLTE